MPRSCSASRQCHGAGRRRFHRHAHRRVTPHGGAGSYRPRERFPNTAVSSQDQVHPQPPDQRCPMCPCRPSCPRLTARSAAPSTSPPSHPRLGQGRRLAQFRCGRWIAPFRRIITSKHGDWARRRPPSGHPRRPPGGVHARGPAMASRVRRLGRLVRRRRGHHYPRRWCHLAWLYPAATTLMVLASANHFLLDVAGGLAVAGPGHARYQPAQPAADTPPDRAATRSHGSASARRRRCLLQPFASERRTPSHSPAAASGGSSAVPGRS